MNYISTWLYIEEKNDTSYYTQVGGSTAKQEISDIYWKCIFDFFHSSLKFNKNINHIFFTNIDIKTISINDINLFEFFIENKIEVVQINLTNKTPKDWFGAWRNQFYLFDILEYIKLKFDKDCKFLILDSDCIFTKNIDDLFECIDLNKNLCLDLNYDKTHNINGISESDMTNIYNEIFNKTEGHIKYYGGEFFAADYESICNIIDKFKLLWKENYKRYDNKHIKLNEEAHFLSCLYKVLNIDNNYGNKFTKRMWTAFKYNNIQDEDQDLSIWHLPAEKRTGFIYLFERISKDYNKYLSINDESYRKIIKNSFGIPKKNLIKQLKDIKVAVIKKIK